MYDDKLDGIINETLFRQKNEEYKRRQFELRDQIAKHETADLLFHVTAHQVMQLAKRAWDIFRVLRLKKKATFEFCISELKIRWEKLACNST